MTNLPEKKREVRWSVVVMLAFCVSMPMVWVSLAKVITIVALLVYMSYALIKKPPIHIGGKVTITLILIAICCFAISAWHSPVDDHIIVWALAKHAKLLLIVALLIFIRNKKEAETALGIWVIAQSVVLILSLLQLTGVVYPWQSSLLPDQARYVIFSTSYIDQSIMFVMLANVCWYWAQSLKAIGNKTRLVGLLRIISITALCDVLLLLPGRTGYVVAIASIVIAFMWHVSIKWRVVVVAVLPLALLTGLYGLGGHMQARIHGVFSETQQYAQHHNDADTSSGFRLYVWKKSIEAIKQAPFLGHGVGTWEYTVKSLPAAVPGVFSGNGLTSNPHQEYLLWGVELGLLGIILLVLIFLSMAWIATRSAPRAARTMWSVLIVVVLACLFNSSVFDDQVGDFICVTLGLVLALCAASPREITS